MWEYIVVLAGILATPVLAVSYVPQIWNLYKTKSAEGISLSFWLILDTALICLFVLAVNSYLVAGTVGLVIAQALNLVLALIVTVQVVYYKNHHES